MVFGHPQGEGPPVNTTKPIPIADNRNEGHKKGVREWARMAVPGGYYNHLFIKSGYVVLST